MGICRHCRHASLLIDAKAKFCPECGKPFPVAFDDPATWRARPSGRIGSCRTCGYEPVAFDAPTCPCCGDKNPNPSTGSTFVGRGTFIGLLGGGLVGAVIGLIVAGNASGAIAGFLMGCFPGILAGYIIGSLVGGVISGMRGE